MTEGVSSSAASSAAPSRPRRQATKRRFNDENAPPNTPEGGANGQHEEQEFEDDSTTAAAAARRARKRKMRNRGIRKRGRQALTTTGKKAAERKKRKTRNQSSSSAASGGAAGRQEEDENEQPDEENIPDSVIGEELLACISKDFFGSSQKHQFDKYHSTEEDVREATYRKLFRFVVLQCVCGGRPLRKRDVAEVLQTHSLAMPMLDRVNNALRRKFGLELVPLLETVTVEDTARKANFVSGRSNTELMVVIANRDDEDLPEPVSYQSRKDLGNSLPRTDRLYHSLAMVVMSIVLLQDEQCATAELIKTTLARVDSRFSSKKHPTFGEWESTVFRQFVDDGILDALRENNEVFYYLGPVARCEIGAPNLYDFAHRVTEGENMHQTKLENALRKESLGVEDEYT
eukprot:gb/GECG01015211.1/.p1 GENE.gb/GECG01015211.1/~~gb/GECG01015211.1/.p1  ORF type:complete len:403 (+),score=75.56 gb/GECG01015211.1/:1-1209(+)